MTTNEPVRFSGWREQQQADYDKAFHRVLRLIAVPSSETLTYLLPEACCSELDIEAALILGQLHTINDEAAALQLMKEVFRDCLGAFGRQSFAAGAGRMLLSIRDTYIWDEDAY